MRVLQLGPYEVVEKFIDGDSCEGCVFNMMLNCDRLQQKMVIPQCSKRYREDRRNVIFVERHNEPDQA